MFEDLDKAIYSNADRIRHPSPHPPGQGEGMLPPFLSQVV